MNCLEARIPYFIYIHVNIGNTFINAYQYINIKLKWLAAVNSLELGECFQKFDDNMIYLVNLLYSNWLDTGLH